MALAIILFVLLVGSIIFNFVSPWQATPVASNWGSIDTTITITFIITGIFFVAITLFIVYALVKFRHHDKAVTTADGEHQASYAPDNKKLEWWLTGITTVGICALLAPGLLVYNDFVHVPEEAVEVEVLGQQWRWRFRLPGKDGEFGQVKVSLIDFANPFGIDPEDPLGQDDILVNRNELHFAIDQPVKMLLRSLDVLHNFYVPQFRAKMDMVPGQISYFWFTPTKLGSYEVLCAEYCGVAHYNMKGWAVVDTAEDYKQWLAEQPVFAGSLTASTTGGAIEQGRQLAEGSGCFACHSVDGSKSLGPSWKGLIGQQEILADGLTVMVDREYFDRSITDPNAQLVKDYPPVMVAYPFSDMQLQSLFAYVKSLDESTDDDQLSVQELVDKGQQLAQSMGCIACHSIDGGPSLGPTWKAIVGRTETLIDGSTVVVDDDYLRESITAPTAKLVKGFPPVMQPYALEPDQLDALIAYIKSTP
jgi:cytochrome c oxidase subunit 2